MEERLGDEGPAYDLRTLLRHREVVAGHVVDVRLHLQTHPAASLPAPVLKPSKKGYPWSKDGKDGKRDKKGRGSPQPADVLPSWSARPWNAKLSASAQASPEPSPTMPNLGAFDEEGEGDSQGAGDEEPEDEVAFQVVQATFAEDGEEDDEGFLDGFDGHDGGNMEPDVGYSGGDLDEDPDEVVRQTVEYYLSDENLSKDSFFHSAIVDVPDGWLELGFLLACGRLKKLGATEAQILRVLKDSDNLETRPEGEDEDGSEVAAAVRRLLDPPPLQVSPSGSRRGKRAQEGQGPSAETGNWAGAGTVSPNQEPGATGLTVVRSLLPGYWKDSLGNDVFVPPPHGEMIALLYWKWGGVKKLPIFVDPDKNSRIWCGNGILEHAGYPLGALPGSNPTQLHWRTWDGRLSIWYKEGQDPWAGDDGFGTGAGGKGGGKGGGNGVNGGGHWVQDWAGEKGGGKGHRWKGGGWKGGSKGSGHGVGHGIGHGAGTAPEPASPPPTATADAPAAKGAGKKVTGGKGGKGGEKGVGGKGGAHALTLGDFMTVKEAKGKKKKKATEVADGPEAVENTL